MTLQQLSLADLIALYKLRLTDDQKEAVREEVEKRISLLTFETE